LNSYTYDFRTEEEEDRLTAVEEETVRTVLDRGTDGKILDKTDAYVTHITCFFDCISMVVRTCVNLASIDW
jgi:hypothetical protein